MTSSFTAQLEELAKHRGVIACLLVGADDGIVIDAVTHVGEDGGRVAALVGSLYRKARRSANAAGFGHTGILQLEADRGRYFAIGGNDVVLVVMTDREVNVGAIRVALMRAAESLAA